MVKWFLFESAVGNWLLSLLERATGLAVVEAGTLANTRADLVCPATCGPGDLCESHCRQVRIIGTVEAVR